MADENVTVWRGLIIEEAMPRSPEEYIAEIKATGCPLGADGGKGGVRSEFQLAIPRIPQHEIDPYDAVQRVLRAGANSDIEASTRSMATPVVE